MSTTTAPGGLTAGSSPFSRRHHRCPIWSPALCRQCVGPGASTCMWGQERCGTMVSACSVVRRFWGLRQDIVLALGWVGSQQAGVLQAGDHAGARQRWRRPPRGT